MLKRTLISSRNTQHANLGRNPPFQATKQHLNTKQHSNTLFILKKEIHLSAFNK